VKGENGKENITAAAAVVERGRLWPIVAIVA